MSDQTITASPPVLRRLWVVVLLTCLILTMPVALILLATGEVYRRKDGAYIPLKPATRFTYLGFLVLWLVAATLRMALQPGGISGEWQRTAGPDAANTATSRQEPQAGTVKADASAPPQRPEQASAKTPDMNVSARTEYGASIITITADDDKPFVIERLVINDREGDEQCDLQPIQISDDMTYEQKVTAQMRTKLPTDILHRGESVGFTSNCGETLRVAVYTNHGVSRYRIIQQ